MKNRLEDNRCLFFLANSGKNNFFPPPHNKKRSPQLRFLCTPVPCHLFEVHEPPAPENSFCVISSKSMSPRPGEGGGRGVG